jgi:hypothetical protein
MFGKRLYKSSALKQFMWIYISIALLLLLNLTLQTMSDPLFVKSFKNTFSDVVSFHVKYPQDFLTYILTIFIPAIYYSFIRGIVFYEQGMRINRGFPFFNRSLAYKDIEQYKVIHPKFLMGVKRKDIGEEFIFTVKDVDRVIAIFDQHNIKGELGDEAFKKTLSVNKKLVIFFISFSILMFFIQYFGVVGKIFRTFQIS